MNKKYQIVMAWFGGDGLPKTMLWADRATEGLIEKALQTAAKNKGWRCFAFETKKVGNAAQAQAYQIMMRDALLKKARQAKRKTP